MSTEEKTSMKPSGNFFVFYCIVLFMFAAILITISFLSKEGIEQQLEHTSEKASGFESKLEQVNAKNEELETEILLKTGRITELEKTKAMAASEIAIYLDKIEANEQLVKLMIANSAGDIDGCRQIIALNFSGDEDLRTHLSAEGLTELVKIETNLETTPETITKGE